MAGITLAQAEMQLANFLAILTALGVNAEVTLNGQTFKRHQLPALKEMVDYWNKKVISLTPATNRVRQAIPL